MKSEIEFCVAYSRVFFSVFKKIFHDDPALCNYLVYFALSLLFAKRVFLKLFPRVLSFDLFLVIIMFTFIPI